MQPKVSFIIPHKGREEMLLATLDSLSQQTVSSDHWNVYVVTQNSKVSEKLLDYSSVLTIIHNDVDNTISHSRNLGAVQSNSEYLAFLDADVKLSNNWLEEMLNNISKPQVALVSAIQKEGENAPPLEKIRTALSNAEVDSFVEFLPGRNLFLAREMFNKVGGFPEHLTTCEDYFFTGQVRKYGSLFYTSSANYVHIGEDKYFHLMFKKEIWRGQSNVASLSGRSIPISEIPSFIVPITILFCNVLSIALLLLDFVWIAIMAATMGLFPALLYSLRLKLLVGKNVSSFNCIKFYCYYFPARAIGTLYGVFHSIETKSHQ